jgi:serine/threonine-protein kinase
MMTGPSNRIGDYEIIREIAEGGMGKVFLARNVHLPSMLVVLKFLKEQSLQTRFQREASALSQLSHTNICQIRHFFIHGSDLIIVMEYIDGQSLTQLYRNVGSPILSSIRHIFVQVLDGLAYAHSRGIAHRDMKPSNVMIDSHETIKIIDFGIARHIDEPELTMTGVLIGSPRYMAPEQFTENNIQNYALCDVYSVGISLYEMCCGRPPFEDTNPYILKEKHCREIPTEPTKLNPKITPQLSQVISKAIAKNPSDRFQSAPEMRDALRHITVQTEGRRRPGRPPTQKRSRAKVISLTILLIALAVAVYWQRNTVTPWLQHTYSQIADLVSPEPSISIPEQTITENESFLPFELATLLPDEITPDSVEWSVTEGRHLSAGVSPGGLVRITRHDAEWNGSDSIWFHATFPDNQVDSAVGVFTVTPVNDAPRLRENWTTRTRQGAPFRQISLDDIVEDVDDHDSAIMWHWEDPQNISLSRDGERNLVVDYVNTWSGSEKVKLVATDSGGLSDVVTVTFIVQSKPKAPQRFDVTIKVLPADSRVRDDEGIVHDNTPSVSRKPGDYMFTTLHKSFPLYTMRLHVGDEDIDTVVNLSDVYGAVATGQLGVSVVKNNLEVLNKEIIVNGFRTGHFSRDSLRTMIAGTYTVSIGGLDGLEIDSTAGGEIVTDFTAVKVSIEAGKRARVKFHVSDQD